ncbi:MAG TPA: CDP-archaeol synthase [Bacteroidales bacterium]|jgi:phosphatidate cytidylyltransferase|nr:CDP-archaeol synthase [Bacteroidales bacterium]
MSPPNFRTRTLTAILFAVVMVGAILLGVNYFAALMLVVYILGMGEFYRLFKPYASNASRVAGTITGALIFILIFAFNSSWIEAKWLWAVPLIFMIPFLTAMFDNNSQSSQFIGISLAGIMFISVPLSLLSSVYLLGEKIRPLTGAYLLLMILVILWVYDSAAYILGSSFGRHTLYKRLSPGKTWEGCIGGLVFGLATAFIVSYYLTSIQVVHWIAMALIIMIAGTLGDLCESMLKRHAGVKDSGTLLPGHGGILDRFDALFFTAPVIYFYLIIFVF